VTQALPGRPFLVRAYEPTHGGVDFLGLRQANLDMMATCIPGINNVTRYVRVFSVLCWMHWRYQQLAVEAQATTVSASAFREFRDRVETLFTWGHVLSGHAGIPGTTAKPPPVEGGTVPLTFKAWNRSYANTGLMSAVQYGPAAKTLGGLGFLDPVEAELLRVCGEGVVLAEALDLAIAQTGARDRLGRAPRSGTEQDALSLFEGWSIGDPSPAEREAFRRAYFDRATAGGESSVGRRSATLSLAFGVLNQANEPVELREIRPAMAYGRRSDHGSVALAADLRTARWRWVVLQVRQLQRLAHECLLGWVERRIAQGDRDSDALVDAALRRLDPRSVPDMVKAWTPSVDTFDEFCELAPANSDFCIFAVAEALEEQVRDPNGAMIETALRALFLCAKVAGLLRVEPVAEKMMAVGQAERVSLSSWRGMVERSMAALARDFIRTLIESMVLSQHFAVAANRYDGGTQRLRVAIEEDGLAVLAPDVWRPTRTPDRLSSALALALDCGLIGADGDGFVAV